MIRYSESVGPGGKRDVDQLVKECEKVNAENPVKADLPAPAGLEADSCLYVKSACGPSLRAGLCVDNLKARSSLKICNVTEDAAAAGELEKGAGKNQAPCLMVSGKPMFEAGDILKYLADRLAPLPA